MILRALEGKWIWYGPSSHAKVTPYSPFAMVTNSYQSSHNTVDSYTYLQKYIWSPLYSQPCIDRFHRPAYAKAPSASLQRKDSGKMTAASLRHQTPIWSTEQQQFTLQEILNPDQTFLKTCQSNLPLQAYQLVNQRHCQGTVESICFQQICKLGGTNRAAGGERIPCALGLNFGQDSWVWNQLPGGKQMGGNQKNTNDSPSRIRVVWKPSGETKMLFYKKMEQGIKSCKTPLPSTPCTVI